jgi:hypothetical protein
LRSLDFPEREKIVLSSNHVTLQRGLKVMRNSFPEMDCVLFNHDQPRATTSHGSFSHYFRAQYHWHLTWRARQKAEVESWHGLGFMVLWYVDIRSARPRAYVAHIYRLYISSFYLVNSNLVHCRRVILCRDANQSP